MKENPKLFECKNWNEFGKFPAVKLSSEITLRDLFAAAALAGMTGDENRSGDFSNYATDAFRFADAMLSERSK